MRKTSQDLAKLIEQLESTVRLAEEAGLPVIAYSIEALDEARAADWTR